MGWSKGKKLKTKRVEKDISRYKDSVRRLKESEVVVFLGVGLIDKLTCDEVESTKGHSSFGVGFGHNFLGSKNDLRINSRASWYKGLVKASQMRLGWTMVY